MHHWDEMFRQMQRDFFGDFWKPLLPAKGLDKYKPATTDVRETDKEVIAAFDMPGIDKKDIELNVTEDTLSVRAEKKHEVKKEEKGYFHQERSYAGFYRQVHLPAKVLSDKAKAKYDNGVLKVIIPKAQPKKKEKSTKVKVE